MKASIDKANSFIEKRIIPLFVLSVVSGLLIGNGLGFAGKAVQEILIFTVSFSATLKMPFSRFKASINFPLLAVMFIFSHLLYPVLVFLFCKLFFSDGGILNDFATGLILIYSIPCAITLVVWVILAEGDAGISFAFVILDNLLGFLMTPVLMKLFCGKAVEIDTVSIMKSLLIQVVIPSVLGMIVSSLDEKEIKKNGSSVIDRVLPYVRLLSRICLFSSVVIASAKCADSFFSTVSWKYLGVAFSCVFLIFASFCLSTALVLLLKKPLKISKGMLVSATYGCSMKNCGTSTVLAGLYLPPLAVIPCIIDLISINLVASSYTKILNLIVRDNE